MHARQRILELIKTQLKTIGFPGVWLTRTGPIRNSFPGITVFADSESIEIETIHSSPRPQQRFLRISVVVWIKGSVNEEKAESDMNIAAEKIEIGLLKPDCVEYMRHEETFFSVDQDEPEVHSVTLVYLIEYITEENNPAIQ